jgi:RNA polymerase sigma factor (sigma-70 family)
MEPELDAAAESAPPEEPLDLADLHRDHFAFVWRTLRHLGVPGPALDDAVQDVFLVVHRRLDSFEGRSEVRTWLYAIARRVAFRHRRGAQRTRRKLDALATVPAEAPDLEAQVAHGEAVRILDAFLGSLDDRKREVFVLHTLEGVGGPAIASALGIGLNTVHSRLRLARRSFELMCERLRVEEHEAIAQARRAAEPPAEARRRAWALLVPALELPKATISTAVAWTLSEKLRIFAATVVVGTAGTGAVRLAVDEPSPAPVAVAPATTPVARTPPRLPPTAQLEPAPAAPLAVASEPAPAPRAARPRGEESADALARETELLRRVRSALDAGAPERALELLDGAERGLSPGPLAIEREGHRALALCEAGRELEGRGAANLFLAAHPASPVSDRVRTACTRG